MKPIHLEQQVSFLMNMSLGYKAYEINKIGAQIAVKAASEASTDDWPRYVAGSMGPTTKTLSVTGGTTFDQLARAYEEQAIGLIDGGVDLLLLETSQDMLNVKAGFVGIQTGLSKNRKILAIDDFGND